MGVTPGLLCQTRHLGHSHQLHWSDVSKLELWYCLPSNWELFAHTKTSSHLLCSTNLRNTLRFVAAAFFGQDKRLEMSLQYTHAEVNVQLQSRVDALEAVEDACTLAEAWQAQVFEVVLIFLEPSDGTSDTKVGAVWSFGILKKVQHHLAFCYLWLVKKWSFCQWQGVAGQERGGWCWVWMLKMTLLLWFYQKCVWNFCLPVF